MKKSKKLRHYEVPPYGVKSLLFDVLLLWVTFGGGLAYIVIREYYRRKSPPSAADVWVYSVDTRKFPW